jgi:hypothetical protein
MWELRTTMSSCLLRDTNRRDEAARDAREDLRLGHRRLRHGRQPQNILCINQNLDQRASPVFFDS